MLGTFRKPGYVFAPADLTVCLAKSGSSQLFVLMLVSLVVGHLKVFPLCPAGEGED